MRLRHGIGLAVFCLLAGSGWLVDEKWPDSVSSLLSQSLALLLTGAGSLVFSPHRRDARLGWAVTMRLAAASILLLAAPILLGQFAHAVHPETSVAFHTLAPLCVVGAVTFTRDDAARSLMVPAIIGLAGAVSILPWQVPSTATATVSFAEVLLAVVLTAAASVWLHSLLQGVHPMRTLMVVAFPNAAVLGLAGFAHGEHLPALAVLGHRLLRALWIDCPQLCLVVWLLRGVAPERLAARFFIVPLITIVEGLVVLHGTLDFRSALGLLLLLFGAGALLLGKRDQALRLDLR